MILRINQLKSGGSGGGGGGAGGGEERSSATGGLRIRAVKAQLAISYGGQVMVFDDFPADNMEDIMLLATGGKTKNPTCTATSMVPNGPKLVPSASTNAPVFSSNMLHHDNLFTGLNDLPIARKESLARFLEKRKAR